jgi:hypothetical protein
MLRVPLTKLDTVKDSMKLLLLPIPMEEKGSSSYWYAVWPDWPEAAMNFSSSKLVRIHRKEA